MLDMPQRKPSQHRLSLQWYNWQVESINRILKAMLQRMVGKHKSNWHIQIFSALWAYRTSAKTSIGFTLFQLVYGLEAIIPIECEIPSLKLTVNLLPNTTEEEQRLLYLSHLDEIHWDAALANESHHRPIKNDTIDLCILVSFHKGIFSWFMTKIKIP